MTKLGVVAGLAILASAASAQSNGPIGLSVRLGAFFPTGTAGENIGHTWFAGGLDYKLSSIPVTAPTQAAGLPSYLSISADYYVKNDSHAIPVALNYNVRAMKNWVFSAGIGAEDMVEGGGSSTIGLAGQVAAAYDFTGMTLPVFLQAKYFISGKDEFRGFGVFVGARF
jgi:hypothetical protein